MNIHVHCIDEATVHKLTKPCELRPDPSHKYCYDLKIVTLTSIHVGIYYPLFSTHSAMHARPYGSACVATKYLFANRIP